MRYMHPEEWPRIRLALPLSEEPGVRVAMTQPRDATGEQAANHASGPGADLVPRAEEAGAF